MHPIVIRVLSVWFLATSMIGAQVLPKPHITGLTGVERVQGRVVRCTAPEFTRQVEAFVDALSALGVEGARLETAPLVEAVVFERRDKMLTGEYAITTANGGLRVVASDPQGAAHAAASLVQSVRVQGGVASWPPLRIVDGPDHPFRAFMVDMGRNPHSPRVLRQVVDMLWLCKANMLQLHLTDDQLISWPSEAFPALSSARAGWTREDFVQLEAYASARGVMIVPELDVPGHSTILRREYPNVFGETPTELATTPEAQAGVETLLAEMLAVFTSTAFVHIGGDEAYGVPLDVQRDFINRLNRFVTSTGRRTLVWEGPALGPEGGRVDRDVIHMNWRTIDFPAQQMVDAGYEVVNASWDPHYIVDHYPRTMFTAVDVERCYAWDVQRFAHINHEIETFGTPHRTRDTQGLIGFCMPWWEGREENLFPLCLPRLSAVASAAWNRAGEDDFADFELRLAHNVELLGAIAGVELPAPPVADAESQRGNVAFLGRVTPSSGARQPPFGPERLTNGIADRFDRFLGFPAQPEPLEIRIELVNPARVGRVVVHEAAVGKSHELYELLVSGDGEVFESVGRTAPDSRGDQDHVVHRFAPRRVSHLLIRTRGCHGLTFPSFSRLTEVRAFAD